MKSNLPNSKKVLFTVLLCLLFSSSGWAQSLVASNKGSIAKTVYEPMQDKQHRSLIGLLNELGAKHKVHFNYDPNVLKDKMVDVSLSAASMEELDQLLTSVLSGLQLKHEKLRQDYYVIYHQKDKKAIEKLKNKSLPLPVQEELYQSKVKGLPQRPLPITTSLEEIIVTGRVTDAIEGTGLPGVNILIKGTTIGTVTDNQGNYRIALDDNETTTLVFSSVGYETEEVTVGGRTMINILLTPSIQALTEIVVTALGIEKETKALGYATVNVDPEDFTVNRSPKFMDALQGKTPGVNIQSLGSGPQGSTKIRIRGLASIGNENQPLIVINGIPVDNSNFADRRSGNDSDRGSYRSTDSGDGLSSINPDDVTGMTILKGAAASALYGSRARNGVIMITTRNRAQGTGLQIDYNTNYTVDVPMDFRDYQYEYGQGEHGVRPTSPWPDSGNWSFGEKFEPGMTQILFDGVEVPYEPQRNQLKEFYRNGSTFVNTITVSTGGESGGLSLSLSNLDSKSIVPNSDYNRKTINLGFTQRLADKLQISGSINYSREDRKNPPNTGRQEFNTAVGVYTVANSMPMSLLKQYAFTEEGDEALWTRWTSRVNPYFTLSRFENNVRDRIYGNITAKYNITDWLYLQGRVGQDYYTRDQDYNTPTGTRRLGSAPDGFYNGQYIQDVRRFREVNADFLVGFDKTFGDIGVNATVGGNRMYQRKDRSNVEAGTFYNRGKYTLNNASVLSPQYDTSEKQINSLYGSAEVSYKEFIYLNATVRNDWFSTLSPANRSILYPSVTASFVFSQAFPGLPDWLSFGKIRAAYAEVGSDGDIGPYENNLYYSINQQQAPDPNGNTQGVAQISSGTIPNPDLRPMRVSEKEFGLELELFNNLRFEASYYDKLSFDQILNVSISNSSGFGTRKINLGESRNKGIEMLAAMSPVKGGSFEWNISANAAYNTSEVISLGDGLDDEAAYVRVGGAYFHGELRQVVGMPMSQLYGYGYLRDPNGNIVYDAGNGRPRRSADQLNFGSAIPRWIGGITNTFYYKNVSLSFLIDFKLGHKMISGTHINAYREGFDKATLVGRDVGYVIGEGVMEDGDGNFVPNTAQAEVQPFYEAIRSFTMSEQSVFDAGSWQLRQITIGYDLTSLLKTVKFIEGAKLSFVANNVAVLKKWVPHIHPDQDAQYGDNYSGLEATGLPVTRSMGFNLNVKF